METDTEEHPSITLKDKGNAFHKNQSYGDAIRAYTEALASMDASTPENVLSLRPSLLANRAASRMETKPPQYAGASEDCAESLRLDASNVKTMFRKVRQDIFFCFWWWCSFFFISYNLHPAIPHLHAHTHSRTPSLPTHSMDPITAGSPNRPGATWPWAI